MNSERKAFEEWFCKNHTGLKPSELIKFRTDNGYSFKDSIKINCMWESWQASTQRQGYKLVPLEINDEIESAMFSSVARGDMPCEIYKAVKIYLKHKEK